MKPEEIDIANEIARLEAMYKHSKILYRKFLLLCCSNERKVVKHNRDQYKINKNQVCSTKSNFIYYIFFFKFFLTISFNNCFVISLLHP